MFLASESLLLFMSRINPFLISQGLAEICNFQKPGLSHHLEFFSLNSILLNFAPNFDFLHATPLPSGVKYLKAGAVSFPSPKLSSVLSIMMFLGRNPRFMHMQAGSIHEDSANLQSIYAFFSSKHLPICSTLFPLPKWTQSPHSQIMWSTSPLVYLNAQLDNKWNHGKFTMQEVFICWLYIKLKAWDEKSHEQERV